MSFHLWNPQASHKIKCSIFTQNWFETLVKFRVKFEPTIINQINKALHCKATILIRVSVKILHNVVTRSLCTAIHVVANIIVHNIPNMREMISLFFLQIASPGYDLPISINNHCDQFMASLKLEFAWAWEWLTWWIVESSHCKYVCRSVPEVISDWSFLHSSAISWQGLYTTPTYPGVELGWRRAHNLLDHLMPQFDSALGPDQVMCCEVVKCYLASPADLLSYELRRSIDLRYLWPPVLYKVPWVPTTSLYDPIPPQLALCVSLLAIPPSSSH